MVAEAYEAELKNLDEQQRIDLAIERLRAQEAVRTSGLYYLIYELYNILYTLYTFVYIVNMSSLYLYSKKS